MSLGKSLANEVSRKLFKRILTAPEGSIVPKDNKIRRIERYPARQGPRAHPKLTDSIDKVVEARESLERETTKIEVIMSNNKVDTKKFKNLINNHRSKLITILKSITLQDLKLRMRKA